MPPSKPLSDPALWQKRLARAMSRGYERIVAWSDLLDSINVFPVQDADTGLNLAVSLAPLMRLEDGLSAPENLSESLLTSATGNSGNIAAAFLVHFVRAPGLPDLADAARKGAIQARGAIADPKPGTMLTVFDALADSLSGAPLDAESDRVDRLIEDLRQSVLRTREQLGPLKAAGVVDAGALGMFLLFEALFRSLEDRDTGLLPIQDAFEGSLVIRRDAMPDDADAFCIDTLVELAPGASVSDADLAALGRSVVVGRQGNRLKLHLHTDEKDRLKQAVTSLGHVVRWKDEAMERIVPARRTAVKTGHVHVMTDAAGSMTRTRARELGITLLESFLVIDGLARPETSVSPDELYPAMKNGIRVSTSQASVFLRHQSFSKALSRFETVIYLCVGSVYTGNYAVAKTWKEENDPAGRLILIDTTAASGRLGLIAEVVAGIADSEKNPDQVAAAALKAVGQCTELLFLERLKYLVAGGRLSKPAGIAGDLLGIRPVISPTHRGAEKIGTARTPGDQIRFAVKRLKAAASRNEIPRLLIEYSDNRDWIETHVRPVVQSVVPGAAVQIVPLSLTSGAHMGPGTWGIAFMEAGIDQKKSVC